MQRYYRSTIHARSSRRAGSSGSDWRTRGIGRTISDEEKLEMQHRIELLGIYAHAGKYYGARKEYAEKYWTPEKTINIFSPEQLYIYEKSPFETRQKIESKYESMLEKRFYSPFMTTERFERESQTLFGGGYSELSFPRQVSYIKKFGTFGKNGESWASLEKKGFQMDIITSRSGKFGKMEIYKPETITEWKQQRWANLGKQEFGGVKQAAQVISGSYLNIYDPGYWTAYMMGGVKGGSEYIYQKEYDITQMLSKKDYFGAWFTPQIPAYENVILPLTLTTGIGAGIGAVESTKWGSKVIYETKGVWGFGKNIGKPYISITRGSIIKGGIFGYSSIDTIASGIKNPIRTGIGLAIQLPSSFLGYKTGYTFGYGRVEEFNYLRKTYGYGTADYYRGKSILKVARDLQNINIPRGKFDIMRDIENMDIGTSKAFELFLKEYKGKFTLTGSGATRGQLGEGFRIGRDIDIYMKKSKYVSGAVDFLKMHGADIAKFDIHGPEFGKVGMYHGFGFVHKPRVTLDIYSGGRYIGKAKSIKAGEQLFRKAFAAARIETQYRWGKYPGVYEPPNIPGIVKGPKDIADFVNISDIMISKSKTSYNPFTRIRGRQAELNLGSFLYPEKYNTFPLFKTFAADVAAGQFILPTFQKFDTKRMFIPEISPTYPTGRQIYPISDISLKPFSAFKSDISLPKLSNEVLTTYIPSISINKPISYSFISYKPSYNIPYTPSYTIPKYKPSNIPSYIPPYIPRYTTPYTPSYQPPYTPAYKPPYSPPPYKPPILISPPYTPPPYKPSTPIPPIIPPPPKTPKPKHEDYYEYTKRLKKLMPKIGVGYRFRKWKTPSLKDFLKI